METKTIATIDYSAYARTKTNQYYILMQEGNGPIRFRHERTAQPIEIPGVVGDFFCMVGEEFGKWGVAPYCIICEGLTGAKLHTDFTKEAATHVVIEKLTKYGTGSIQAKFEELGDNVSPRYRKL